MLVGISATVITIFAYYASALVLFMIAVLVIVATLYIQYRIFQPSGDRTMDHKIRTVVEAAHDGVWVIDEAMRTTYANRRMATIMGRDRDEMMGKTLFELMPEEMHDNIQQSFAERQQGISDQTDFPVHRADGTVRWTIAAASPIMNTTDGFEGAVAVFTDITERKNAEEALRQSEQRMRMLLQNMPVIVFTLDADGVCTFSEGQALKSLGLEPGEFVGRAIYDFAPRFPEIDRLMVRVYNGETVHQENSIEGKRFMTIMEPLKAQGHVTGVTGITVDLSDRHQTEAALTTSENRYQLLFETVDDVIYMQDGDGYFTRLNPAFERILGYKMTDWIGRSLTELIHPDDDHFHTMSRQVLNNESVSPFPVRCRTADGIYITLEVSQHLLVDDKEIIGLMGIARDITDRRNMETRTLELALERERLTMLSRFIKDISHDIRTPLSIINSNVYLALRKFEKGRPEDLKKHMHMITREVKQLTEQLDNMLTVDNLGHRRTSEHFYRVDLNQMVHDLVEEQRTLAEERAHTLDFSSLEAPLYCWVDALSLKRAYRHVLLNALNYTPKGGHIKVSIEREAEEIYVCIADDGIGIAETELEHIWEPFYRVDEARSHDTGGMGLGLNVCKLVMDAHHGRVEVRSEPGEGSAFTLVIPCNSSA